MKVKIFILIVIIFGIYFLSWFYLGESNLLEKGMNEFLEAKKDIPFEYNQREEFVVVSKKYREIINYDYNTKIPGKKLLIIKDKLAEDNAYTNIPNDFSWDNITLWGLEINIKYYNFPIGQLDWHIFGNDIRTGGYYYIWAFVGWIRFIPLSTN